MPRPGYTGPKRPPPHLLSQLAKSGQREGFESTESWGLTGNGMPPVPPVPLRGRSHLGQREGFESTESWGLGQQQQRGSPPQPPAQNKKPVNVEKMRKYLVDAYWTVNGDDMEAYNQLKEKANKSQSLNNLENQLKGYFQQDMGKIMGDIEAKRQLYKDKDGSFKPWTASEKASSSVRRINQVKDKTISKEHLFIALFDYVIGHQARRPLKSYPLVEEPLKQVSGFNQQLVGQLLDVFNGPDTTAVNYIPNEGAYAKVKNLTDWDNETQELVMCVFINFVDKWVEVHGSNNVTLVEMAKKVAMNKARQEQIDETYGDVGLSSTGMYGALNVPRAVGSSSSDNMYDSIERRF